MLFVPPQAVGGWERDETKPIVPLQVRLSEVFGISRASLIEGHAFKVPAPGEHPRGTATGAVMAKVGTSKTPLLLPATSAGEVWSVVVGGESPGPVDVNAAAKILREVIKHGGRAWVVVEPPAPEKPVKNKSTSPKPRGTVQAKSKN